MSEVRTTSRQTVGKGEVGSLHDYVRLMVHAAAGGWIFRGQADADSWALRPKAGRKEYCRPYDSSQLQRDQSTTDLRRFNAWRQAAIAYCPDLPDNDFECLAMAQHYGLATRLLDWTQNPLVALYFAVESQPEVDGAVYSYFPWMVIDPNNVALGEVAEVSRYIPRPFDRRVLAQAALFTYHPDPSSAILPNEFPADAKARGLDGPDLWVVRISAERKPEMKGHLNAIGVNRKTLFPDLEGLSDFVNWETRVNTHWREKGPVL